MLHKITGFSESGIYKKATILLKHGWQKIYNITLPFPCLISFQNTEVYKP